MNQEIRQFLIDQCVKGESIYYEVIGQRLRLNLSIESDRHILSSTLGEISAFEHENNRPLISSIVIYKQKNDHGHGFYNLCEELGIGKASKLEKEFYGFTQIEECKKFWQKSENYQAYYSLVNKKDIHKIDFFTKEEIEFLASWGGKVYDKNNDVHIAAKNYIINSIGIRTQYWSNNIASKIPNMDKNNRRMWSKRGWANTPQGKIQVSLFKEYTWARIYRKGDDNKDIFFTVGVDGNTKQLVYKLDYYFEKNSHLNQKQKEIVDKNIPKDVRWKFISISDLKNYNWDSLLDLTIVFISENIHIYDKLIKLAWNNSNPEDIFTNFLRSQEIPKNGYSSLPTLNPSFNGVEKDFIQDSIDKKEIGDAGEELVKQYEINKLRNIGLNELADQVKIEKDGKGYDILSFDENRNPKYIEVKTTTGKNLTPFDYTLNEKLFAEQNLDSYFIYRLYNYNEEDNTADFFVIQLLDESVLMQPITYKVYLKKKE